MNNEKLITLLNNTIKDADVNFTLGDEIILDKELLAPEGLLTLFLFLASDTHKKAQGKPLGLYFEQNPNALITMIPKFKENEHQSFAVWAHYMHYAIEELTKKAVLANDGKKIISLNDTYENWLKAMRAFEYTIEPQKTIPKATQAQGNN